MTDKEIIKALECCKEGGCGCGGCYFKGKDCTELDKATLDLINRLQKEQYKMKIEFELLLKGGAE